MSLRTMIMASAMVLVAANAQAMLKVTNMSPVPQTVVFSSAGTDTVKVIQPNQTERFMGTDGKLSLRNPQAKPPVVGQDPNIAFSGMAAGWIGAVRTSDIPASPMDEFVIWPDGRLMLQKRQKSGRNDG